MTRYRKRGTRLRSYFSFEYITIDLSQWRLIRELTSSRIFVDTVRFSCPVVKIAVSGRLIQDERCERACIKHRGHPRACLPGQREQESIVSKIRERKKEELDDDTSKMRFPLSTGVQIERNDIRLVSVPGRSWLRADTKKSIFNPRIHHFFPFFFRELIMRESNLRIDCFDTSCSYEILVILFLLFVW